LKITTKLKFNITNKIMKWVQLASSQKNHNIKNRTTNHMLLGMKSSLPNMIKLED